MHIFWRIFLVKSQKSKVESSKSLNYLKSLMHFFALRFLRIVRNYRALVAENSHFSHISHANFCMSVLSFSSFFYIITASFPPQTDHTVNTDNVFFQIILGLFMPPSEVIDWLYILYRFFIHSLSIPEPISRLLPTFSDPILDLSRSNLDPISRLFPTLQAF